MSNLDVRMWFDPKRQARVYVFHNDSREVIRVYGHSKAKLFAWGVQYGAKRQHVCHHVPYLRPQPSKLEQLEIELSAVETAIDNAMFRVGSKELYGRRAELLGQIKEETS
jgi:hypothetical protein